MTLFLFSLFLVPFLVGSTEINDRLLYKDSNNTDPKIASRRRLASAFTNCATLSDLVNQDSMLQKMLLMSDDAYKDGCDFSYLLYDHTFNNAACYQLDTNYQHKFDYEHWWFGQLTITWQTRAYVCKLDDICAVSFQGTASTGQIVLDGIAKSIKWRNQEVHTGFVVEYNDIGWKAVKKAEELGCFSMNNLLVTGHSLGGAVAQLFGYARAIDYPNLVVEIATWGSPKPFYTTVSKPSNFIHHAFVASRYYRWFDVFYHSIDPIPTIVPGGKLISGINEESICWNIHQAGAACSGGTIYTTHSADSHGLDVYWKALVGL